MDRTAELWAKCQEVFEIDSGSLFWQSPRFQFRHVFLADGLIYKVVDLKNDASGRFRARDLRGEFLILQRCAGIAGVPATVRYYKGDEFEVIVMKKVPGVPLGEVSIGWVRLFKILGKLAAIIFRLSWRGVSHNDISLDNVLVTPDDSVYLVDFDQSSECSFLTGLVRQFFGRSIGGGKVNGSTMRMLKKYLKKYLKKTSPKLASKLRKLRTRKMRALPVLPDDASSQLKNLLKAWDIAQASDASAPGQALAYYSLSFEGYLFPGERPWIPRWDVLSSIADYSGKRVLELGCNMCLLSTFLLKYSNATAALAVDRDPRILEAAELVNSALGVKPLLKVQDFDAPKDWEAELADFNPDIVFALNVLNWVKDKKRLMNFLGRFEEVIFEGHESYALESARLRDVGFTKIDMVGDTDRGRKILHCRK